jgi:hypothetical protein
MRAGIYFLAGETFMVSRITRMIMILPQHFIHCSLLFALCPEPFAPVVTDSSSEEEKPYFQT